MGLEDMRTFITVADKALVSDCVHLKGYRAECNIPLEDYCTF